MTRIAVIASRVTLAAAAAVVLALVAFDHRPLPYTYPGATVTKVTPVSVALCNLYVSPGIMRSSNADNLPPTEPEPGFCTVAAGER